jgi:hypothetical protein
MRENHQAAELAAFICVHVFDATRPVLLVAREHGDWMFLCGQNHTSDDDYRMAGTNHLLDRDETLNQVLDLGDGYEAERKVVGGPWVRRALSD